MNKEIEWTGEFNEDYAKCALKYGKGKRRLPKRNG